MNTAELRKLAESPEEYQYTDGHIRAVYASGALESKNEFFKDIRKAHFDEWLRRHDAKLLLRAVVAEGKIARALEAHAAKHGQRALSASTWGPTTWEKYVTCVACSADWPCATVRILTEGDPE